MAQYFAKTGPFIVMLLLNSLCISPLLTTGLPATRRTKRTAVGEQGEFFEGDILLTASDRSKREAKNMIQDVPQMEDGSGDEEDPMKMSKWLSGNLWPEKIVYYKIDPHMNYELRPYFAQAINVLKEQTCLKFEFLSQENKTQDSFINLTDKRSCSSYVGRIGGSQDVSISSGCAKTGHALHELGHAIGLPHEHTKLTRDKYIKINWDNMEPQYHSNFNFYPHHSATESIEYDFQSVMHYSKDAFAKGENLETIEVKEEIVLPDCIGSIGQRKGLSFKDKLRINKMYNCEEHLQALEDAGDDCPLGPQPPVTPITPTTPTVITDPPCRPVKTIATGDIVNISMTDDKGMDNMICTGSSCVRKDCEHGDCLRHERSFRIYMTKNRKNRLIKDTYEVVLRDTYRNKFVDCSREDGCRLTKCDSSPEGEITNYSKDLCSVHKLELHTTSAGKKPSRISTSDLFYFKAVGEEKYLNCNDKDKVCKMVSEDECASSSSEESSGSSSGSDCLRKTLFRIHREQQVCR